MRLILNESTEPYFNLAAEQYLMENAPGDIVMLWRNSPAVVVGRNQNTAAEVDEGFLRAHGIPVVRRMTGGGAVFHDLGNVNFTVIRDWREGYFGDYSYFTAPVREFLSGLGIKAELSGRNDLLIDGMKCSGNAQTSYRGRFMHHGTLLFSADVADISGALRPDESKFEGKAVRSVASRVTNISGHLPRPMTAEEFIRQLHDFFAAQPQADEMALTDDERQGIQRLADERYSRWEWNYGASPRYSVCRRRRYPFGSVEARFSVEGGAICNAAIYGDFFGAAEIGELCALLDGAQYRREAVLAALYGTEIDRYISGMTAEQLWELLADA